jgi:hypothetical protein
MGATASAAMASDITFTGPATVTLSGYTITQTITQTTTERTAKSNSKNNNSKNDDEQKPHHTNKTRGHVGRMIPLQLANRGETAEMIVRRQSSSECSTKAIGTSSSSALNSDFTFNSNAKKNMLITTHAVMAWLAFAFFFPVGGIIIRLCHFPGTLWAHAGLQMVGYVLFTAAVGLGIYIASKPNSVELHNKHPIIGLFLFALLTIQVPGGWMHHMLYEKYGGRTYWSYLHLWIGRISITLGIINAGFGFMLTGTTGAGVIVYVTIAGVVWVAYVLCAVLGENQRRTKMVKTIISSPRRMSAKQNTTEGNNEQELNSEPRIEMGNVRNMVTNVPKSTDAAPSGLALHPPHPRHYHIPLHSERYYWKAKNISSDGIGREGGWQNDRGRKADGTS